MINAPRENNPAHDTKSNSQEPIEVVPLKWLVGASIGSITLFLIAFISELLLYGSGRLREAVPFFAYVIPAALSIWLLLIGGYIALDRHRSRLTIAVIVWFYFTAILFVIQVFSLGVRSPLFNLVYILMVFTGFLLGNRQLFLMAGFAIVANLSFYAQEQLGWMALLGTSADFDDLLAINFSIVMMAALIWRIHIAFERRSIEVNQYQFHLEQLVTQKTAALQTALTAAENANQAKSSFLATMSHELRTPLNAIIGYTEMAQEELLDGEITEDALQDLARVEASGRHLLGMINTILDLSKVEAGKEDLRIESLPIDSLVTDVSQISFPEVERSGNRLIIDVCSKCPSVKADRQKLTQILLNLIGNATKFTQDGEITLSVHSSLNRLVHFTVRDTGIGLPEDKVELIFKPFQQLDNSYSRQYGGSGLGLAISKKYSEMMGGDIYAENHPDGGAQFRLTLPSAV